MEKFKNKYRIPSARLQTWDYGNNGSYFITICTKNRDHLFGEIVNGIDGPFMQLTEMGKLAEQFWIKIPFRFPFIELGNFVVMPNHFHGILIIDKHDNDIKKITTGMDIVVDVETQLITSLHLQEHDYPKNNTNENPIGTNNNKKGGGFAGDKNPMFHKSISRICRWYKGRCTFEIRKFHADFELQPRFYDHIIRNAASFERIQNYIATNTLYWKDDKLDSL